MSFRLFVCFVCFVVPRLVSAAAPTAPATEASFVRLWPGWRDAESFDRIAEYLGAPEPTGARVIVRTRPDDRAGYYFLLRVHSPAALTGAKFELAVIRPDAPDAKTFTFPATGKSGDTVFDLGVTGADWPGGKSTNPVAWKLTLRAPDGRILAERKSFLWEQPPK